MIIRTRQRLLGTASHLLIANSLRYAGQAGILLLIARNEGATSVGTYALSLAVTAPIFILFGLGLRTVILTLDQEYSLGSYLRLRLWTMASALGVAVAIAAFFAPEQRNAILAVALIKAADGFSDVSYAFLQRWRRVDLITWYSAVSCLAVVGAVAWVTRAGGSLTQVLMSAALASSVVVYGAVLPHTWRRARDRAPTVDGEGASGTWRTIVRAGLPVGLSWGMIILVASVPQYFLAWSWDPQVVGRYAVLLYITVCAEIILNALVQAWIPDARTLNLKGAFGEQAVVAFWGRTTLMSLPVGGLLLGASYLAIPRIFGSDYALTSGEIGPLAGCLLVLPTVFIGATALAVRNRYLATLYTSAVPLIVVVTLSYFAVPGLGIDGALWVNFLGLVVRAVAGVTLLSGRRIREISTKLPVALGGRR